MNLILPTKILPVSVIERLEDAIPLAETLIEAGVNVIEVTLRTEQALASIEAIRNRFPDMLVGAGTVIDKESIDRLSDLGVHFIVAPGTNPPVIEKALDAKIPVFPGVTSPSEIDLARGYGLKVLKYFPAEAIGGVGLLKALCGPYGHTGVKFIPTGGINQNNAAAYLSIPQVAAIGGSWFVSSKLVTSGQFDKIKELTVEALELSKQYA